MARKWISRSSYFTEGRTAYVKDRSTGKSTSMDISDVRWNNALIITRILTAIFLILLIVNIFNSLTGNGDADFTFSSFMEFLSGTPQVDMDWIYAVKDARITGSWGAFDFLKDFLNGFMDIITFLTYLIQGCLNLLDYAFYTLKYFFFKN